MSIPDYHVITQTAASLTNLKWETVAEGKKTTRLALSSDPRFHIAISTINKTSGFLERSIDTLKKRIGLYIEIKGENNEPLFININSVAKRLFLPKAVIRQAAKENKLMELLKSREASGDVYQKIIDKVRKEAGTLKTEDDKTFSQRHYFTVGSHNFAVKLRKKGGMKLTEIGKKLGSGLSGDVFIATNVNKGIEEVYKQAKPKKLDPLAEGDVLHEYHLLSKIHSKGTVWGIQARPHKLVAIHKEGEPEAIGFLGKKYDGDYFDELTKNPTAPFTNRLFEFHQLLFALKYLAANNIVHGDLKPDNIFVLEEDGSKLVHLADVGGAREVSNKTKASDIRNFTFTPSYFPREDERALNSFKSEETTQQIELRKKGDVFAMGVILHGALSGLLPPFYIDKEDRPILTHIYEISDSSVPTEIKDLIKKMVDADYTQRPSAAEAFNILDKYIKENDPALAKEIKRKMKAL